MIDLIFICLFMYAALKMIFFLQIIIIKIKLEIAPAEGTQYTAANFNLL